MNYDFFDGKKNNKGNGKLIAFFSFLFVIPTVLCIGLFIMLASVKGELDTIKASMYGTSEQTSYAADTSRGAVTATLTNSMYEAPVAEAYYEPEADLYSGMTKVYITFDDGPSTNTDKILDILDQYGVKATFFVNAHDGYDDEYWRIVSEGHTIGMHSYSHSYSDVYESLDSFAEDLYEIQTYIYEKTGVESVYYRFPGGSSNNVCKVDMNECTDYLDAKGIVYFDWNASAQDAVSGGASTTEIVNNVMASIYSGKYDSYIVLMHDCQDKSSTVEALPIIIENIAAMENTVILPIDANTPVVHHGAEN